MTWEAFASGVRTFQRGFMGVPKEVRPGRGGFHENPSTCICEDSDAKVEQKFVPRKFGKDNATNKNVVNDDSNDNDEPEWPDMDDEEDQDDLRDNSMFNGTSSDYEGLNSEDPELDVISD